MTYLLWGGLTVVAILVAWMIGYKVGYHDGWEDRKDWERLER